MKKRVAKAAKSNHRILSDHKKQDHLPDRSGELAIQSRAAKEARQGMCQMQSGFAAESRAE
jgi:hypothetical protein